MSALMSPCFGGAGAEVSAPALTISSSTCSSSVSSVSLKEISRADSSSRAEVAALTASLGSSMRRWQAAMLECRTALGKRAERGRGSRASR